MNEVLIYILSLVVIGQSIRIYGLKKDLKIMNLWCLMQDELICKYRQRKSELDVKPMSEETRNLLDEVINDFMNDKENADE